MRYKGTVVNWNESKGFGFIKLEDNSKEIFAHISDFKTRFPRNVIGEKVTFDTSKDEKGRFCAANIKTNKLKNYISFLSISYLPVIAFIVAIGFPIYQKDYPIEIAYWVGMLSILTVFYYARDKAKAQSDRWRISEDKLHLFSVLGGWPGAVIAQQVFRHKTAKKSFQRVFWATVLVNCCVVAWTFTTKGSPYMYKAIFSVNCYTSQVLSAVTPVITTLIDKSN
ncbi:MAG: cold shock and DUF1294 domain-containing protein [Desulfotalea sp.]